MIRGFDRDISLFGFAVRLALPFVAGVVAGLLNPEASSSAGAAAAGLGALVAVWPPLVNDDLRPPAAWGRETEVQVVYVLYVAAFVLLGLAGGSLASYAAAAFAPSPVSDWLAATEVPSSTSILTGLVLIPLGSAILYAVRLLVGRISNESE